MDGGARHAGADAAFARLLEVIAALREHCPWMGALTHSSLVEYLIEESYELVEAIEGGHGPGELMGELGDVLLQVVLHARLAEESGDFNITEVVSGLTAKMVRRNPHVFRPDGALQDSFPASVEEIVDRWHAVKKQEKPERTSPFDGIPAGLPALALAAKTIKRAERAGGADDAAPIAGPTGSDTAGATGLDTAGVTGLDTAGVVKASEPSDEAALGSQLFDIVREATARGLDAERALRAAVVRYQHRVDPG